jgi:asparagine synthase (glutamine-hydrolysing)
VCGIAGIVAPLGSAVDRETLAAMTATLAHRGPDGSGVELPVPHVGLGHRRLSIIDLATGAQPMATPDRRLWITFNGEIFNYRELRRDLAARGRAFATNSDTEVLLASYELDGLDGLQRLRGQYAFAIWDQRVPGGRLVLARDPLGIKPLHYSFADGLLLFASEPRALLAHPRAPRTVDPFGLHLYLRYRFIPAPRSAWLGIQKLLPGELLVLEAGQLRSSRPWRLRRQDVECDGDLGRARAELYPRLLRAVDSQQVADVPVGAFLSGGIDSSTIASMLAQVSGRRIATFTIGFDSPAHDESAFAAAMAQQLDSEHHSQTMTAAAAATAIEQILAHLDEPFGDPSLVPTWFLCQTAARHHKVVLSGDGGDELFGGYSRSYRALGVLRWPRPLRRWNRLLQKLGAARIDPGRWTADDPRVGDEYLRLITDVGDADAARLYGARLQPCRDPGQRAHDPLHAAVRRYDGLPPFSRILLADMEAHLADYHLAKVERASMAHSLEVRVPFLDLDFVEWAFKWTPAVRLSGARPKGLLRDVLGARLPAAIIERPKQGFGPPLSAWLRGDLGDLARARLLDGAAVGGGWLDRRELLRLLAPGQRRPQGSRIWRLLVLEHWLRR